MEIRFKRVVMGLFVALMLVGCGATEPVSAPIPSTMTSIPATETVVPSPEATPIPFEMTRDIFYISEQLKDQKLDVYIPNPVDGNTSVILAVHGGGGDKGDFLQFARHFAEQGYATVSINYRQMPKHTYPAPMKDTYCALAWIYANADEYHFDTTKIAAVGHSLGGTFVAALGTMEDPTPFVDNCPNSLPEDNLVHAVITFTGVFDYNASTGGLLEYYTKFFEASPEEAPELWTDASPVTWIDSKNPPFLLVHGGADGNIPPEHSINFASALDDAGAKNELLIIPDGTHFSIINHEEAYRVVTKFLLAVFGE